MTKRKRLLLASCAVIGLVGLTVVGAGVWFFFGDSIRERLSRQRFEPVTWKAVGHSFTNAVRIRMVEDLLRRHSFRGMTREQVTGMLEPTAVGACRSTAAVHASGWRWLGFLRCALHSPDVQGY